MMKKLTRTTLLATLGFSCSAVGVFVYGRATDGASITRDVCQTSDEKISECMEEKFPLGTHISELEAYLISKGFSAAHVDHFATGEPMVYFSKDYGLIPHEVSVFTFFDEAGNIIEIREKL